MSHVTLTTKIVCAWLSNNYIHFSELPHVIKMVSDSLAGCPQIIQAADVKSTRRPAVPIEKSVTDDVIVCLEDGLRFKTLKKHLRHKYNPTPDEYRHRWGLPTSYPMVAPAYSRKRSDIVRKSLHGDREQDINGRKEKRGTR
ncbi:UNVERIFIED_ORG: putative transcriptional regulator [Agrobacterium larrymoorei]|uniref:MucR family transcriptional regulator n=2 Tax=Rhizobium/Agrobacterium group TaxID=227290 RepID=A0AA92BZ28_RHIRH|nr:MULTISPECIES: MucR family transcriptional regulator [Rhizobium/Agrobacterium group]MDP9574019.1 putative transcriptional regulator [Agrobacterium larrymoorei]PVE62634.1 MucR family transcriptional regulator [Agrobacterium tumefaciens]PVE70772.1 MucR family transcriptional regulator [Sphingomonas sp. TPD3009]PVE49941.1 MucR family transcriptional regulator [Rhizobium rhizogenes]TBN14766.1 MucR family transcriptional regulator [Agrobacterium cavarae]